MSDSANTENDPATFVVSTCYESDGLTMPN